ncbi:DUF4083 family protein [Metabacillus fastidiosus]|uniref:DUF4083 family protein n=1 Tax=Metabacillus fastidiosus TaxID=1458 RepID=UPI002DB7788A|nr:DUF4083 family protein [Metabacillus fastidiosus]MEC2074603.1 DUF4083 family protein [Metabacillus fastidiosus]
MDNGYPLVELIKTIFVVIAFLFVVSACLFFIYFRITKKPKDSNKSKQKLDEIIELLEKDKTV